VTHPTTICAPIYQHPLGPHLMTVEILPAELPRDASKHFSKALGPYLKGLVKAHEMGGSLAFNAGVYEGKKGEEARKILETLDRATIAENGVLRPQHSWLMPRVEAYWTQKGKSRAQLEAVSSGRHVSTSSGDVSVSSADSGLPNTSSTEGSATKPIPSSSSPSKKRILLLGSGMVAKPAVDVFLGREDVRLVVGKYSAGCRPECMYALLSCFDE
jgi:alpha-aminoadipic semialdehyde synthase